MTPHQISKNNIPDESFFDHKVKLITFVVLVVLLITKTTIKVNINLNLIPKKGIYFQFDEKSHSYIIMDYNNLKI